MNQNWKNFLNSVKASFEYNDVIAFPTRSNHYEKLIYPITQLAVLTVSGKDAAKLLQGQITCNINDINETKSSLGALCNPKGRTITTFLLIKTTDAFLMVLPKELLESVKKRLQMYILRSAVTLTDSSETLCLIGLSDSTTQPTGLFATSQLGIISINLSTNKNRQLVIADADKAIELWSKRVDNEDYHPENSDQWLYQDIVSGIPWLTTETSEEFIPQMLNLDQLGAISFNKGCYTGQEIIARTHYLGKTKRTLYLAECHSAFTPKPNSTIIDNSSGTEENIGKVLIAQRSTTLTPLELNKIKMLIVLQANENETYNLALNDDNHTKINLLTTSL
ncbi:MAG: YgfZ/GcvT domain-containing protein [Methylococcales bacterium]|jgi:folate-binding protein YgfZ